MNIGIHFFDSLLWLFGEPEKQRLHLRQPDKMSGTMELPGARVRWFLSVDAEDIPLSRRQQGKFAYRLLSLDGQEIDLSEGFTDLHTRTYEEILAGRGYSIADARAGVEAVHAVRQCELTAPTADAHPWLADRKPSSFRRAA